MIFTFTWPILEHNLMSMKTKRTRGEKVLTEIEVRIQI